jgi:hypothetical protein
MSYITDRRAELENCHYLRMANIDDHWFDFSVGKVERYRSRLGDRFCLVVFLERSEDAWVIPFEKAKACRAVYPCRWDRMEAVDRIN